jgi:hypothetical protein
MFNDVAGLEEMTGVEFVDDKYLNNACHQSFTSRPPC